MKHGEDYYAGRSAARAGRPISECPYLPADREGRDWRRGWLEGQHRPSQFDSFLRVVAGKVRNHDEAMAIVVVVPKNTDLPPEFYMRGHGMNAITKERLRDAAMMLDDIIAEFWHTRHDGKQTQEMVTARATERFTRRLAARFEKEAAAAARGTCDWCGSTFATKRGVASHQRHCRLRPVNQPSADITDSQGGGE